MKSILDKIFVLTSVTYAMKSKELLAKEDIPSSLTREAAIRQIRSCGYGLRVAERDVPRAESVLQKAGVRILGVTDAGTKGKDR